MLHLFDELRSILDDMMLPAIQKRILLYGYGYTGRFLRWYAEYYHSIKVDYIVTLDTSGSRPYDEEIFQSELFEFGYKDVRDCVVWLAEPLDEGLRNKLKTYGYIKDKTYYDFYDAVYGKVTSWGEETEVDSEALMRRKSGRMDIQFLEWLERKYGCNFVQSISSRDFEVAGEYGCSYVTITQKELFPLLDRCRAFFTAEDAVFDFGCGKGGALISFMDYGFQKVGGVEYEPKIFDILMDNMKRLNLHENRNLEFILGNAAEVKEALDKYNWFYFFDPFYGEVMFRCIDNICESLRRNKRKIYIININPRFHRYIEGTSCFRLMNQFTIATKKRVVSVYESLRSLQMDELVQNEKPE